MTRWIKNIEGEWGGGPHTSPALGTKDYLLSNRGSPLQVALLPINYFPIPLRSSERLPEKSCFLRTSKETFGVLTRPLRCVLRERCTPLFFFFFSCRSSVRGRVASSPVPWSEVFPSPLLPLLPVTARPKASREQNERNVKKFPIPLRGHCYIWRAYIM